MHKNVLKIPLVGIHVHKELKWRSQRDLHYHIHCCIVHNKENVVYVYNGILPSFKKKEIHSFVTT